MRRYVVLAVALAVVGLACQGTATPEGQQPNPPAPPPNACLVYADNPHLSSTDLKKGKRTLIGKGWFQCSVEVRELNLYVEVEKKVGAGWNFTANGRQVFHNPGTRKSDKVNAIALGCPPGTFRTKAKGTARDDQGRVFESAWGYSQTVVEPCSKGAT